jgi:hypothetical protein
MAESTNSLRRDIAASTDTTKRRAQDASLREKGYKLDTDGGVIPLDPTELSPKQRADLATTEALTTYRQAQAEHAQAQAEFERTKNDPNSPAFKQAQQRLDITSQRLSLSKQQFEMRAFGTNQGEALPGSMIGDDGKPIGTAFQGNVRPTAVERNKSDMATSASEQLADIRKIINKRPDIFGPLAGRKVDFDVWLGSQDPDAQAFLSARDVASGHLAGTFGARAEKTITDLQHSIGQFKDNPQAALAGLSQVEKAVKLFEQKGQVKTTGSDVAKAAPAKRSLKNEMRPPLSSFEKKPGG